MTDLLYLQIIQKIDNCFQAHPDETKIKMPSPKQWIVIAVFTGIVVVCWPWQSWPAWWASLLIQLFAVNLTIHFSKRLLGRRIILSIALFIVMFLSNISRNEVLPWETLSIETRLILWLILMLVIFLALISIIQINNLWSETFSYIRQDILRTLFIRPAPQILECTLEILRQIPIDQFEEQSRLLKSSAQAELDSAEVRSLLLGILFSGFIGYLLDHLDKLSGSTSIAYAFLFGIAILLMITYHTAIHTAIIQAIAQIEYERELKAQQSSPALKEDSNHA